MEAADPEPVANATPEAEPVELVDDAAAEDDDAKTFCK